MPKVWKMLKKAVIITMEDQISYCNRTIQVGPHLLVVTAATMDTSGECSDSQAGHEADRRLFVVVFHRFKNISYSAAQQLNPSDLLNKGRSLVTDGRQAMVTGV